MLPEQVDALVGSMLGKDYRVLQPIGSGGMAVVYLVEHQTLLKRFAAKVLSSELASSLEARARFTQEAHAASQLDHENIVSISDFGVTADQRPFFVMELLRGQTLDQRLTEGPMSLEEVVAVSVPVARALAHAHAEGIVHRDVKPENIFLVQRSQGRWGVKVVDFGIAKTPVDGKLTQTKTKLGETLGSPLFMAPEMVRGEDDVDPRTDIYSFGVLLYLMLCRRLPFFDENLLKVMQMHLVAPVPPPRQVNPALSAELAQVIERALAKRREDRYPNMAALLADLEAVLPLGADRLLIEAQSGAPLRDTAFASALSMPRMESQRSQRSLRASQSDAALRTMRVAPLRAPVDEAPRLAEPRAPRPAPPSRRIWIVTCSALVSGLLGAMAWWQITTHRNRPASAAAVAAAAPAEHPGPIVTPISPPSGAAAKAAAQPAPGAAGESPPETAAADELPAPVAVASEPVPRAPVRRASVHRDPARFVRRPATAAAPPAPGSARTGATALLSSSDDEPLQAPPQDAAEREPAPAAPASSEPVPALRSAAPPLPAPAKPSGAGSLDAVPALSSLDVKGSLAPSVVRRSVERSLSAMRACYQAAARAGSATPEVELQLSFEVDENSLATHVATRGAGFGSLAGCVAGVVGQLHTQQAPDVGTAQVSAVIRFRPS